MTKITCLLCGKDLTKMKDVNKHKCKEIRKFRAYSKYYEERVEWAKENVCYLITAKAGKNKRTFSLKKLIEYLASKELEKEFEKEWVKTGK